MKKRIVFFSFLLLLSVASSFAAKVDTVLVKSPSMNKDVEVVVIVPDVALGKKGISSPVIYLLHGYSGNAKSWLQVKPDLPQIADEKGLSLFVRMGKTVGIGTARRMHLIVMKHLSLQSY
nr:CAZy families CE1 protein [uncultured Bacteroides sp.]